MIQMHIDEKYTSATRSTRTLKQMVEVRMTFRRQFGFVNVLNIICSTSFCLLGSLPDIEQMTWARNLMCSSSIMFYIWILVSSNSYKGKASFYRKGTWSRDAQVSHLLSARLWSFACRSSLDLCLPCILQSKRTTIISSKRTWYPIISPEGWQH